MTWGNATPDIEGSPPSCWETGVGGGAVGSRGETAADVGGDLLSEVCLGELRAPGPGVSDGLTYAECIAGDSEGTYGLSP